MYVQKLVQLRVKELDISSSISPTSGSYKLKTVHLSDKKI